MKYDINGKEIKKGDWVRRYSTIEKAPYGETHLIAEGSEGLSFGGLKLLKDVNTPLIIVE